RRRTAPARRCAAGRGAPPGGPGLVDAADRRHGPGEVVAEPGDGAPVDRPGHGHGPDRLRRTAGPVGVSTPAFDGPRRAAFGAMAGTDPRRPAAKSRRTPAVPATAGMLTREDRARRRGCGSR